MQSQAQNTSKVPSWFFLNIICIFNADNLTDSIKKAVSETERHRTMQISYNKEHGIVPTTILKPIREKVVDITDIKHIPKTDIPNAIIELDAEMREAADRLDFERAIQVRELIKKLEEEAKEI